MGFRFVPLAISRTLSLHFPGEPGLAWKVKGQSSTYREWYEAKPHKAGIDEAPTSGGQNKAASSLASKRAELNVTSIEDSRPILYGTEEYIPFLLTARTLMGSPSR